MKRWFAGLLAVMVVVAATGAFAFGPGARGGCGGFGPGDGPGAFGRLDLSKEQFDKMWQLKDKFRNETKDIRYEMQKKRAEMRDLYADSKVDDATIRARYGEMNALRQKLQDKKVEFRLAQRSILTPDQLQQLGEAPCGKGFGKGFGRGGICRGGAGADPAAYKGGGPRRMF